MNSEEQKKMVYFTFRLNTGIFAINVTSAREVLTYERITVVPKAPPYMPGVMNIRGSVITVLDLRKLFAFPPLDNVNGTPVIVTEVDVGEDQPLVIGILADEVDGVTELEAVPDNNASYGNTAETAFVDKLAKKGQEFVLVLNLKKIIDYIEDDIEQFTATNASAPSSV